MSFLALVTCQNIPEPDVDEPLLVEALERAGVPTRLLAWDDSTVDWTAPCLMVIRSTWNYYLDPDAFVAWARRQDNGSAEEPSRHHEPEGRLLNSSSVVAWNHHKRYLRELEAEGLPVVPTLWFERGSSYEFEALFAERGWSDVVVKPAISAGSYKTARLRGARLETAVAERLVASGDAMAQPYVRSVETYGERSLVWIEGELTHAVRKSPRFTGDREVISEVMPIAEDERRLAQAVLALGRLVGSPLYARIDIVRDEAGRPMLSEVELIEPSLFLRQSPAALDRLVSCLARRYRATASTRAR